MTWPNIDAFLDYLSDADIDIPHSVARRAFAVALDGKVLWEKQECKHGYDNWHKLGPNPDCVACYGKGRTIGVSGSDAYAYDCSCVVKCYGGQVVQVWPPKEES